MANILKKYRKEGVIEIGTDKRKLDSPTHEIIFVGINPITKMVSVNILHEAMQGTVMNPHERTIELSYSELPASIRAAGKVFLEAIETERMKRTEYKGSTEV